MFLSEEGFCNSVMLRWMMELDMGFKMLKVEYSKFNHSFHHSIICSSALPGLPSYVLPARKSFTFPRRSNGESTSRICHDRVVASKQEVD